MDLIDLTIFIAVAEDGTATRAAQRLGMTQPGVSQHLARLEEEVGRELFDRSGRRLALNDFGRLFLGKARHLLEESQALAQLAQQTSGPVGTLKLGLTDASTQTVVPPALARFRDRYPKVKIQLDVDDSKDIEEGVLRGHYDLGIISAGARSHPLLNEEILYHDRFDALVARTHALAKKKRITLETLAEHPLLIYPRRSRTRRIIDEVFHKEGIVPREIIDVYINSAAVRLAEVGMGVALLSQSFIEEEIPKRRAIGVRIQGDPFKRTICLVRKRDAALTDAASCFYEILMEKGN